jgi:hypothetical protein
MLPAINSPPIDSGKFRDVLLDDQRFYQRDFIADMGAVERQYPENIIFRNGLDP